MPDTTATATMPEAHQWTDGGDRVLILRRIDKDGTSYGGFNKWGKPDELNITVQPEKFVNEPTCGNGLHGWPWGMGLGEGSDYSIIDDRWLVLAAKPEDVVGNVGGNTASKCKCREAVKIFDGTFAGAWALINSGRHRLIQAMARCVAGYGSQLAASGDSSNLAASGDRSQLAASGYGSQLAASGYGSDLAASGDRSKLAASGCDSQLAASGYGSQLAASGYGSQLAASGYGSQLAASGNSSQLAASGDSSQLAASGDSSKLAASGNRSQLAASGDSSNLAASGNRSKLAASGYGSQLAASGKSSIAAAIGLGGVVAAGELGCIVATYWSTAEERFRVVVGYVGENGIEPNTRYRLNEQRQFEAVKN
jgi:hypothetical protein